jgi:signal peptidase I
VRAGAGPVRRTGPVLLGRGERVALAAALLAFAAAVVVPRALPWQRITVTSDSMAPWLEPGDSVWMDTRTAGGQGVARGDVVVFADPGDWSGAGAPPLLVKRVVGLPGETIACCDAAGRVLVGGEPLEEDYLPEGTRGSTLAFDVVVPAGEVWLMGDHRTSSRDSRLHELAGGHGSVPLTAVVGTVADRS